MPSAEHPTLPKASISAVPEVISLFNLLFIVLLI
jgi:hypothetical protein